VADTRYMFVDDVALTTLTGSGGWNFASATQMEEMFKNCDRLTVVDVTNWDMSKAEQVWNLFNSCDNLVGLTGEENWKLSSAINANFMFQFCYALTGLDVQNWDLSNVTTVTAMFQDCYALEYLNPSKWNTGNCQYFNSLFGNCYKLKLDENALANWDMRSAVRINHMFDGCGVEKLNLSNWNMPNLVTTTHMFADCSKLTSIDFTGWNTPNLISLDCMFNDCTSLTYLDLSSFDTATVQEFSQLFERCTKLERIDGLEKWDTRNGRTFGEMFRECYALKELDLTSFNTRNVIDQYFMEWQPSGPPNMGEGCKDMFYGTNGLNKLVLSADFSFDGDGKVTTEAYKIKLPAPAAKEGFTAKWQDVDTGVLYDASEIPEEKAATYVAYYEPNATNP
jgi:surface protein